MDIKTKMNSLILIIIIVIGVLLVIEIVKRYITKSFLKYLIALLVLIFVLLILSAYFDLASILGKGGTFSQTGEVIATGVEKSKDNFDLTQKPSIIESATNMLNNIKESLRNALSD